ncbi:aminotransferase class I/II-fold pyridoxal phosphate-dependent enzyme [Haloechinothrix sp. YIM 98757]|uniref:Aminotransferase class I/II-fold pyridoxal phosphate-dependent enzyme n=1 Tax=Haloechinothrix aidingensis TaxID=2752311 RepID=A0A838A9P6_9PSEU|nr:aminotransferase class I/II-fold pyridoxal phosphate-dependent enzyme [Haloechinothrix aidingensis]MBA0125492.1 aminotransferase class I/II-fold pyridoxal phosphate-dependent enzyme [Haloechinothrix aidingensis]
MSAEQFRAYGKQVVDWIADYLAGIESYPVRAPVHPGDIRARLPSSAPEHGEPWDRIQADVDRVIMPGVTHWQHPGFFAYFPANASGPAILGELLSAGLGAQGMLWETGPACTELESVVVDWLAELLGLPAWWRTDGPGGGVIQDSASSAALVALVAALWRAGRVDAGRTACTVYVSAQTHSSMAKAARIAGVTTSNLRTVDVDPDTLAMRPEHLEELVAADVAAGAVPTMVCATIGTTSTTAIDPVGALGEVCRRHGVWLHVDAAYAGVAAVCPELRWINDGAAEYADSYVTDPHKWLLTNFDCSVLWVADREPLVEALSILPEYLRNPATDSGEVIDYRDWQVPLGRRFRALKLWMVMRWYGAEGLRSHVRRCVELAGELARLAGSDDGFTVYEHHPFGLVCFRPIWPGTAEAAADEATAELLRRLNDSGAVYLSHTTVAGRTVLRFAVGSPATGSEHVRAAWQRVVAEYRAMRPGVSG